MRKMGPAGYHGPRTTKNLQLAAEALAKLQEMKDKSYGGSWQKYGEKSSVFPNVARKFDRIANIMVNDVDPGDEPIVDTVADLATYSLLWLTYIMEHRPQQWIEWVADNICVDPIDTDEADAQLELFAPFVPPNSETD